MLKENPDLYVNLNQYSNDANWKAHYETTAKEIWFQMNENIDYVVAGLGTSGTIVGVSKFLKEKNSNIKVIGVNPFENDKVDGLKNYKNTSVPSIFYRKSVDEIVYVNREDTLLQLNELVRKEGILAGISSAASLKVAIDLSKKIKSGRIVVIFPDRIEKYLEGI